MRKADESNFDKEDYRSKNYSGEWTKHWLKQVSKSATVSKKSIYEKMWEMCDEKAEHMPNSLLKFYPFNQNSLKCIEANKVYLNSPDNFNDPYDCLICSNEKEFIKTFFIEFVKRNDYVEHGIITESEFEKIKSSYPDSRNGTYTSDYLKTFDSILNNIMLINPHITSKLGDVCYQARKEYKNTISIIRKNKIKVTSFSNFDDELCYSTEMWGHYAASHTGFCVEYDLESKLDNAILDSLIRGGMLPCRYSRKPVFIPSSLFWKYYDGNKLTENQRVQFDKFILLSFLNKSSSWRYEKEWRLIVPDEISQMHGNLIDFYPIKTIYLGVKMSKDDKEYLYDFAKRKNILVTDMRCRTDAYELSYSPVDLDDYIDNKNFLLQSDVNKSKYSFLWDMYKEQ